MSWFILRKSDDKVMFETFDELKVKYLNTDKYYAMTAYDYLCKLNRKLKNERELKN